MRILIFDFCTKYFWTLFWHMNISLYSPCLRLQQLLGDLRVCLREDVREADEESREISSRTRDFFRRKLGGPTVGISSSDEEESGDENSSRYGLMSTIYFHLLTSPIGSWLMLTGDALSWMATFTTRRGRGVIGRLRGITVIWRRWWSRKLISEKKNQQPRGDEG